MTKRMRTNEESGLWAREYGRTGRNGTSLAEQKKQLMAAGVAEEDIYLDAYTGTKMHRPQFDACMAALEPDDEFVVCKLDRFARTATEGTRNCQRPRGARHPRERAEHGDRG